MREREREKERALCYEKVLDGRVELCLCKETKQKTEKESFKRTGEIKSGGRGYRSDWKTKKWEKSAIFCKRK
jgi:hypothetical protein